MCSLAHQSRLTISKRTNIFIFSHRIQDGRLIKIARRFIWLYGSDTTRCFESLDLKPHTKNYSISEYYYYVVVVVVVVLLLFLRFPILSLIGEWCGDGLNIAHSPRAAPTYFCLFFRFLLAKVAPQK